MQQTKRIFFVAGEVSGDKIASDLITRILAKDPKVDCYGMGGACMAAAGARIVIDFEQYAVMGIGDVVSCIQRMRALKRQLTKLLSEQAPDDLVCIDYPGINLPLASVAKSMGIKVIYYVSPKVWASRAYRIKKMRTSIDHLCCILPFEVDYFAKRALSASYVGHPLLESMATIDRRGRGIKTIALMPGSRVSEIKRLAPLMQTVAARLAKTHALEFVVFVANDSVQKPLQNHFSDLMTQKIVRLESDPCAFESIDYAIVASGTATLELAKRGIPMVVVYKADYLTYWLSRVLLNVRYISLCNLIANRLVVPELLQHKANVEAVVTECERMMHSQDAYNNMCQCLMAIGQRMGRFQPEPILSALGLETNI